MYLLNHLWIFLWGPAMCFQFYMNIFHFEKVGNGKRLTMPMRYRIIKAWVKKPTSVWLFILAQPQGMRAFQMMIAAMVAIFPPAIGLKQVSLYGLYWTWFILLYLDDYFTDNDKWKKYWEAAKNRIKWLWTPAPTPIRMPV